jgi:hypothetical protein
VINGKNHTGANARCCFKLETAPWWGLPSPIKLVVFAARGLLSVIHLHGILSLHGVIHLPGILQQGVSVFEPLYELVLAIRLVVCKVFPSIERWVKPS